ncbi:MAG: hypothetical protein HRU19_32120 [Pseudobacteriovorax sp.]|nr:hypothetical protein [Pseudobacteriovorax sp.]
MSKPVTLSKKRWDQLVDGIYYLKVDELVQIASHLGLHVHGRKQQLIDGILRFYQLGTVPKPPAPKPNKKAQPAANPEVYIIQGTYTNGPASRKKLKKIIGDHFHFTTYGMDWIRDRWAEGHSPTWEEFARFWQSEYQRRKDGGEFSSKQTNARVRFFREQKGQGLTKEELNAAWEERRQNKLNLVCSILKLKLNSIT